MTRQARYQLLRHAFFPHPNRLAWIFVPTCTYNAHAGARSESTGRVSRGRRSSPAQRPCRAKFTSSIYGRISRLPCVLATIRVHKVRPTFFSLQFSQYAPRSIPLRLPAVGELSTSENPVPLMAHCNILYALLYIYIYIRMNVRVHAYTQATRFSFDAGWKSCAYATEVLFLASPSGTMDFFRCCFLLSGALRVVLL